MCLLILNKEKLIPREHLFNGFSANSDGIGIGYIEDNILKISKFDKFDRFYKKYVKIRKNNKFPIIIHFRLTSAGKSNEMNMHPFYINKDIIFAHNGHISELRDISGVYSDTYILKLLLKKSQYNVYDNNEVEQMLNFVKRICSFSRFVFLRRDGEYFILNETSGYWEYDNDTWYSNSGYKDRTKMWYDNKGSACNTGIYNEIKQSNYNVYNRDDYTGYYDDMYYNNVSYDYYSYKDIVSDNKLAEYDFIFLNDAPLSEILRLYSASEIAEYFLLKPGDYLDKYMLNDLIDNLIKNRQLFINEVIGDAGLKEDIIKSITYDCGLLNKITFSEFYDIIKENYEDLISGGY